ncbi:DNA repair protein RadC [Parabacteroides sp. PF5-5]|uniref:JAB domain-containing protein n=1 Tax=unclassified Parabacteroides TaxID=2649774 RepID=UPI002476F575|nr:MULTISPECIES: JAB domain-containing protein [unclassified Parabacteroides]MDH6306274.1 DNA repair protein RadC [Parabacteroides sp. PH5-39]MDH6316935.1 DNA repair protein RadC [Parabacteroides sp. PF5-13]MDH6321004.1 DNA repair protein RadC [Parabacteroides sp. PH5-13]MDH6324736.1 DNA repair protein RadC [Parabacteroides sp. PH5-8]MDH6328120.1 DNA repair protein RadC [Parabacteroides sp. PH5-41]
MKDVYKVCDVTIHYEPLIKPSERLQIKNSRDIFSFLMEHVFDMKTIQHKESFNVVLLNRASKVLGVHLISEGGVNGTIVDIRLIIQSAILSNSSGIILCHNHPSGNMMPSNQDRCITNNIQEACKLFDITVLDHLIITAEGYYSFADEGVL